MPGVFASVVNPPTAFRREVETFGVFFPGFSGGPNTEVLVPFLPDQGQILGKGPA